MSTIVTLSGVRRQTIPFWLSPIQLDTLLFCEVLTDGLMLIVLVFFYSIILIRRSRARRYLLTSNIRDHPIPTPLTSIPVLFPHHIHQFIVRIYRITQLTHHQGQALTVILLQTLLITPIQPHTEHQRPAHSQEQVRP